MLRQFFFSRLAFMAAAAFAVGPAGEVRTIEKVMDYRTASGGRRTLMGDGHRSRSKYMPHQGSQECARRVRQMAKAASR
jgi:hypothetical protein